MPILRPTDKEAFGCFLLASMEVHPKVSSNYIKTWREHGDSDSPFLNSIPKEEGNGQLSTYSTEYFYSTHDWHPLNVPTAHHLPRKQRGLAPYADWKQTPELVDSRVTKHALNSKAFKEIAFQSVFKKRKVPFSVPYEETHLISERRQVTLALPSHLPSLALQEKPAPFFSVFRDCREHKMALVAYEAPCHPLDYCAGATNISPTPLCLCMSIHSLF